MRAKKKRLVITFPTTSAAMAMEKLCKEQGLPGRLIPTPRELTADCGMAWCAPPGAAEELRSLIRSRNLAYEGWQELLV